MKILQIIYESLGNPYGFGGAGVRAYEIYRRLRDRHDVTLLCMRYPGARDGEIEGLRHVFVGSDRRGLTRSVLAYTREAAAFVRKRGGEFDVIVENFLPSTPFFSTLLTKTPIVLQVQGIMEHHSLRKFNPLYSLPMYLVERYYPYLFRRFMFVSEVTRDKVLSRVRGAPGHSWVVPNGIDRGLLGVSPEEGGYVLFFSRLDIYTKGLDILVRAFERVAGRYPDLRLVLAGYEFDRFDHLVKGLHPDLRSRLSYAGFVTGKAKVELLSKSDMVVLPSRHESAPISILEAAAAGKPVIVSDIPELRFVEEQGFGIAFPSGSVGELADAMLGLLGDRARRAKLGASGRRYAGGFLWNAIALRFEAVLKEAATHKSGS